LKYLRGTVDTKSSQTATTTSTMNNNLPLNERRPLRPYTSYNLYFTLEKERLLQEKGEGYAANPPSAENIDTNQFSRPEQFRHLILPKDWYIVNAERKKLRDNKKKRPPPHGVLSFLELTKLVSEGWRNVDKETKRFCDGLAAQELKRYKMNVENFVSRHGEDAAKHVYRKRRKTNCGGKRRNHPNAAEQELRSEDENDNDENRNENKDENSNQGSTAAPTPQTKEETDRSVFDIICRPDIKKSDDIPRIGKAFVETLASQDLGSYTVGMHGFGNTRNDIFPGCNGYKSTAFSNDAPVKKSLLPDNLDTRQFPAKAFIEAFPNSCHSSRDIFGAEYHFPNNHAQTKPQSNHHFTSSIGTVNAEPEQEGIDSSFRTIVDEDCAIGGVNDFHPVIEGREAKAPLRLSSCPSFSSFLENEKNCVPRERSLFHNVPTPSQFDENMSECDPSLPRNATFECSCPTRQGEFRNSSQHNTTCQRNNVESIFSRSGQSAGAENPTVTNFTLFNSLSAGKTPTDYQVDPIQDHSCLSYSRANSHPVGQNIVGNDHFSSSAIKAFRRWYAPMNRRFSSGDPQIEMYMRNLWNANDVARMENQGVHKRFKPT